MSTIIDAPNHAATIQGTMQDDLIHAKNFDDVVFGNKGDDKAYGENGNDYLEGGKGDDALRGGHGNDTLVGGKGDDFLSGHDGRDVLTGGPGDDRFQFGEADYNGSKGPVTDSSDIITDFSCGDVATFKDSPVVVWNAAQATFESATGQVYAHAIGLEGAEMALNHIGNYWIGELLA